MVDDTKDSLQCPRCTEMFKRKGWAQHVKNCDASIYYEEISPRRKSRLCETRCDPCKLLGWILVFFIVMLLSYFIMHTLVVYFEEVAQKMANRLLGPPREWTKPPRNQGPGSG